MLILIEEIQDRMREILGVNRAAYPGRFKSLKSKKNKRLERMVLLSLSLAAAMPRLFYLGCIAHS
jgi:hypothetical protein